MSLLTFVILEIIIRLYQSLFLYSLGAVWAMISLLSVVACLEAITDLNKTYYTMYFVKYGVSGTEAGILNAGNAFSYMLVAYVMPRIVEEFGWHTLLILLPIMIGIAILSIFFIVKSFAKFKKETI